jgi:competence ComEA-like helix-hairpin-helix protein
VFDLTPGERRGALVLLALVLLGAGADLLHREPVPAPGPAERPAPAAPAAASAPGPAAVPAGAPVDLNAASEAELDRLPGIGPVLAGRIVAHRAAHGPFRAAEDLLAVPGIGPRLYARLAPLVIARAPVPASAAPLQNASVPAR